MVEENKRLRAAVQDMRLQVIPAYCNFRLCMCAPHSLLQLESLVAQSQQVARCGRVCVSCLTVQAREIRLVRKLRV